MLIPFFSKIKKFNNFMRIKTVLFVFRLHQNETHILRIIIYKLLNVNQFHSEWELHAVEIALAVACTATSAILIK